MKIEYLAEKKNIKYHDLHYGAVFKEADDGFACVYMKVPRFENNDCVINCVNLELGTLGFYDDDQEVTPLKAHMTVTEVVMYEEH